MASKTDKREVAPVEQTMPDEMLWVLHTTKKDRPSTLEWGDDHETGEGLGPLVFASEAAAESFKRHFGKAIKHRRPKATNMAEVLAGARAKGQRDVWTVRQEPDGGFLFAARGIE